jgi:transcriptional regulator with XRE-family HTH domain
MIPYSHGIRKEVQKMGNKLKTRRKELDISIYELAEMTGLSATYISNLENEQKTNPSKDTMEKIAENLKSNVIELFFKKNKN